jgi:hypothetical protein
VLDNGAPKLEKFNADGKLLASWGEAGDFPGALFDPHDFYVDTVGNLYISNGHDHRVDKYTPKPSADKTLLIGQPYVAGRQ